jgi:taurine dioxygenase
VVSVSAEAAARTGVVAVEPLTAVVGAEIRGVDLAHPLDPAAVTEVRQALLRWKVIFFRDQALTVDQFIAFGRLFGEITPAHPVRRGSDASDLIMEVDEPARQRRSDDEAGDDSVAGRDQLDPAWRWHTDITFIQQPAMASILKADVVPSFGGDTMWTNLVAAYEGLSSPVRDFVGNLKAVHKWHFEHFGRLREDHPPTGQAPSAVHPVVRVHPETGERALFVNPTFTRYIMDLSTRESDAVLRLLFDHIARPEYTVRFRWQENSIAFWDNRATAHLAAVDLAHADYDRRLSRITLAGDIPLGPNGFRSEARVKAGF